MPRCWTWAAVVGPSRSGLFEEAAVPGRPGAQPPAAPRSGSVGKPGGLPSREMVRPASRHRPSAGRLTSIALSALAALSLALGCSSHDAEPESPCVGAPTAGAASIWAECAEPTLGGAPLPVFVTNDTTEPAWYYAHCQGQVPWASRLEVDGSWTALLPEGFSLPIDCAHAEVLAPGESIALELLTAALDAPGTYRAEFVLGWRCGDLHSAFHLPAACELTEVVFSEPFELD